MGGRGSGGGGMSRATPQQQRIMQNIKKSLAERAGNSFPTFKMSKTGEIEYSYVETKLFSHVHGGKMQSADKNDLIERVTNHSGTIGKDGLIKKGKSSKKETLIKRGRR